MCHGRRDQKTGENMTDQVAAEIDPHFLQNLLLASFIWSQLQIESLALGAFLLRGSLSMMQQSG